MIPPVTTAPPVFVQKKKGMGCWGCGCLVLALLVLLFVLLIGGSLWFSYSVGRAFTSPAGVNIAVSDGGDAMFQGAQQKITDFNKAVNQHQPASLHLTGDEINTLIARDPAYAALKGHAAVSIQNGQMQATLSLPLGQFEHWVYADRFLNGNGTFTLGFDSDTKDVAVSLVQLKIAEKTLTEAQCTQISQSLGAPLNQKLKQNADTNAFLQRVTKMDVENNELVIETQ